MKPKPRSKMARSTVADIDAVLRFKFQSRHQAGIARSAGDGSVFQDQRFARALEYG